MTKKCTQCHITKSLDNFYKQERGLHGVFSKCKECYRHNQKPLPKKEKSLSYRDYLKQAGLTDYYKRTARYW